MNKHNVQLNDVFIFTNSRGHQFKERVVRFTDKSVFTNGFTKEGAELNTEARTSWNKFNKQMETMNPVQVL